MAIIVQTIINVERVGIVHSAWHEDLELPEHATRHHRISGNYWQRTKNTGNKNNYCLQT